MNHEELNPKDKQEPVVSETSVLLPDVEEAVTAADVFMQEDAPYEQHYIASIGRRLFSFLVDVVVIASLNQIASRWVASMPVMQYLVLIAIYVGYFVGVNYLTNGQTLGKMIFHLRTVRLDGQSMDVRDILLREGVGRIILRVFPILYGISLFNAEKKHLADWIASTCVVYD